MMFHNFVRYDKKSGKILGYFRTTTPDILPKPLSPDENHVEVVDDAQQRAFAAAAFGTFSIAGEVGGGKITQFDIRPLFHGRIELTTDRPDRDGDGVPELPADGSSEAKIEARIHLGDGNAAPAGPVTIRFTASRGTLSRRTVDTVDGVATVAWRSVPETIRVHITAAADGLQPGALTLELIPEQEFRSLSEQGET